MLIPTDNILLRGPVPLSHLLLQQFLHEGDLAVDATCGNGKDTLLLAKLVGRSGQVIAFDIQETAIQRTAGRLSAAGLGDRVRLLAISHELMAGHITAQVAAIVFNLGWLPGADKNVMTRSETTLPALFAALDLLKPGGILLITCYPGHDGGDAEASAVRQWVSVLPANRFHAWKMGQLNVDSSAPFCLLIQKTAIEISC